jgi:hypothetical protein
MGKRKKSKTHHTLTNLLKQIDGVEMGWSVLDPLSDDFKCHDLTVTHKNSLRMLPIVREKTLQTWQWCIDKGVTTKYRMTVEMEFKGPSGTYYRNLSSVLYGPLGRAQKTFDDSVEELFRDSNMAQYIVTRVRVLVIGNRAHKDKDFD